jgi:lipoate-protein ligase A
MLLVRGSLGDVDADREATRRLLEHVDASGEPAFRAWTPPRQVAFGRRDAAADGYALARQAATDHGFQPVERRVGGRAVAYTGETVAFAYGVPTGAARDGIQRRYEDATERLERAFESVGATTRDGEPVGSFCPGDHSLQRDGKLAGIAQRVSRERALVGGCVVAVERDERAIATVLEPVYDALGVRFETDSVGSVETAGGPGEVDAVVDALERAFVGDRTVETRSATGFVDGAP